LPVASAVTELGRYLTFGPTLPAAEAGLGLLGALGLLVLGLARRGQTVTPLLWLLVPAGLTLGLGLLTEPFAKLLLVAVPAVCLLLGNGAAGVADPLGRGRVVRLVAPALWIAAMAAVAMSTYRSLNNLYFNPAYFRDDYRGIARHLAAVQRAGDAVILIAPNQVEAFSYYHTTGAEVYPLPHDRPLDRVETLAALEAIAARHARLFVLFWGQEQADPLSVVETWLNTHTYKAEDVWYGQVRLATYAVPARAAAPQIRVAALFGEPDGGDMIRLEGYSVAPADPRPGDIVQVTLFWRADAAIEQRYKVFVHIYADVNQPPVAQQDGEPVGGLVPTTAWPPGEVVADNHGVLLPASLPPGEYQVMVGLYELFTNARLPVTVNGAGRGDRLPVAPLSIP
jgi:hypothetical protein